MEIRLSIKKGICWCCPFFGRPAWTFILVLFFPSALIPQERSNSTPVMGLMELYGISSVILYGEEDEYAAKVLLEALQPNLKNIKAIPAKGQKLKKDDLVIYVGSFGSNSLSSQAFKSLGYTLNWEALTDGSFLLKTFRKTGKTTVFVAGKDRLGTIYAANDLKNYYIRAETGRLLLNELNIVERAHLKYRWFRNWDYRTNWDLANADNHFMLMSGMGSAAVPSPQNSPEAYLGDMKKTIDFMSQHRLNGLILWGFLRDSHGGVAASQEVCTYANERGVRILPAIGLGGYGGFFYEGESKFSLGTWTKAHPELRAVDGKGNFREHTLCPEKPENRKWYREGLQWIYENFKIGGLHLEIRDFFACYSEDCKKARQAMGGSDPDYYKDMARIITFLSEEARKLDPNLWISYTAYTGFDADSIKNPLRPTQLSAKAHAEGSQKADAPYPPEFIKLIPDFAICQWNLTQMFKDNIWPAPFKAPAKHNMGLLQWGNVSSKTEKQLYFKRIQEITHHALSSNLEGLGIYGEESSDRPNIEMNYLTFSEFAFNPATDNDHFFRYKISRLYGGEEAAKKLKQILDLLETDRGMVLENLEEALRLAEQGLEVANRNGKGRWTKFIRYLEDLKMSNSE